MGAAWGFGNRPFTPEQHATATKRDWTRVPTRAELPTPDNLDFQDPKWRAEEEALQQEVFDYFVEAEKMKVLQEAMKECFVKHVPNHQHRCRPIAVEYLRMLQRYNYITFEDWELADIK